MACDRFGDPDDRRLHLSVPPQPFCGDLRRADIFILLLNPGLNISDYYAQTHRQEFRHAYRRMLAHDMEGLEFPFIFLNPAYCWHGGYQWWEGKLRDITTFIAKRRFGGRYLEALRSLSTRLAAVELVPYHSRSFAAHRLIEELPSAKAAKAFVQGDLVPAATQDKATIIVTRQVTEWGLPKTVSNVVQYEGGHTRGASLSLKSRGGEAILRRYGLDP